MSDDQLKNPGTRVYSILPKGQHVMHQSLEKVLQDGWSEKHNNSRLPEIRTETASGGFGRNRKQAVGLGKALGSKAVASGASESQGEGTVEGN